MGVRCQTPLASTLIPASPPQHLSCPRKAQTMFLRSLSHLVLLALVFPATLHADEKTCTSDAARISNPAAAWQLGASLNHPDGVYEVGQQLEVSVTAPRRCYMHIININPKGEISVLWPLKTGDPSLMESGQTVTFPDPTGQPKVIFEAQPPVGKELIVCFATLQPLNLREADSAKTFLEFLEQAGKSIPEKVAQIRSFVTKIEPTPAGWNALALEVVTKENVQKIQTRTIDFMQTTGPILPSQRFTGPSTVTRPGRSLVLSKSLNGRR